MRSGTTRGFCVEVAGFCSGRQYARQRMQSLEYNEHLSLPFEVVMMLEKVLDLSIADSQCSLSSLTAEPNRLAGD
jgi:hypothetical protein